MDSLKRQIPNALTVFRIILIPVFIYCALHDCYVLSLIVFVIASLTDAFDGVIARKLSIVSNFGKIVDPLADKLLVASALVIFSCWGIIYWWLTAIILVREVFMTIYREVLKGQNIILAANRYGKIKTTAQMVTIIATLAYRVVLPEIAIIDTALLILYFLIAVLAWISAGIYVCQIRKERHGT